MSIQCRDLLALKSFQQIQLIAGQNGLHNLVTWPYINQTADISNWVHGGELVFETGMEPLYSEDVLYQIVQDCITNVVAGIVILCNPQFIPEIPERIIALADSHSLPLFQMPWELRLVDVTKEIANLIVLNQYQEQSIRNFFFELLFSELFDESLIQQAATYCGIPLNAPAFIAEFSLHIANNEEIHTLHPSHPGQKIKLLQEKLTQIIQFYCPKSVVLLHAGSLLCYIVADTEQKKQSLLHALKQECTELQKALPGYCVLGGIGRTCTNVKEIRRSYLEAGSSLRLAKKSTAPIRLICYDEIGFLQLLIPHADSEALLEYCRNLLHPLAQADRVQHTDYLHTLHAYLLHDCNLIQTAKALYIHRNTLVYRMERIREITGHDLSDMNQKSEYLNALKIADFFELQEQL